jgi:hypothetical protein
MEMGPKSSGRMVVALVAMGVLALLVWRTLDPGRWQQLAWLLLAFFALRVIMERVRSR